MGYVRFVCNIIFEYLEKCFFFLIFSVQFFSIILIFKNQLSIKLIEKENHQIKHS